MPLFVPLTPTVGELVRSVQTGDRGIPNFQRDFTWPPDMVCDLIVSIVQEYPVGSLLEVPYKDDSFEPREIEGAPQFVNGQMPSYLILDGQQRLTSLYQSLKGVGRYRYFVNIPNFVAWNSKKPDDKTEDELKEAIFFEDNGSKPHKKGQVGKADRAYGTTEQQVQKGVFPFKFALAEENSYFDWSEGWCFRNQLLLGLL